MNSIFTAFRDWRRARFANAYAASHGHRYTAHGIEVQVPPSVDAGVRYLLAKGRPYELEEAHFIETALAPGTPVIELGGSLGVISAVIRRQIGPDAQHIAVEANPDLAPVCRANAGGGGKTEVVQGAVAYVDAPTVAFSRGRNAHEGKLARSGDAGTFDAPALQLSELVSRLPKAPFGLVCDIEGGELPMLQNEPASTFEHVSHVVMEIHPKAFDAMGSSEAAFLALCAEKGLKQIERRADVILFSGPAA